jgi:hypothetical protein
LYNLNSLTQSHCIELPLVGAEQVAERRLFSRRGLVALCAVVALTVSLAGRVFHSVIYSTASIHSAQGYEKVQHRDTDASQWVPPTATCALLWITEPSTNFEPIGQKHFRLHYDSLYNRPPPVS